MSSKIKEGLGGGDRGTEKEGSVDRDVVNSGESADSE